MDSQWVEEHRRRALARALSAKGLSAEQTKTLVRLHRLWELRGQTLATRISKVERVSRFGKFLKKPFERATKKDIERYLATISERASPSGLNHVLQILKVFYKDLLAPEKKEHPRLVAWIHPRGRLYTAKLPKDLLTASEVLRMTETVTHPRDKAIVMVAYDSAGRRSELASLRVGDVELDDYGARIILRGKTGERRVRLIDSAPALRTWLNHHPRRDDPNWPLFISWKRGFYGGPLLMDGITRVLKGAAGRAGIKRRVHAHLFRHSRLTRLASDLSESELKVFAGWERDSPMAKVYVHISSDDVDRKMLEKAGVVVTTGNKKPNPLRPQQCGRCGAVAPAGNAYCDACSFPLDAAEIEKRARDLDRLMQRLPALLPLMEDADVLALLKKKANRALNPKPSHGVEASQASPSHPDTPSEPSGPGSTT